jgi:hypothetical protein
MQETTAASEKVESRLRDLQATHRNAKIDFEARTERVRVEHAEAIETLRLEELKRAAAAAEVGNQVRACVR